MYSILFGVPAKPPAPLSDTPSATATETAPPFPPVPPNELENKIAIKTISRNPGLFQVVTPIIVDRFEKLLQKHPNRALVSSACEGLRKGFWPYAETADVVFPRIVDNSRNRKFTEDQLAFLLSKRDEEIELNRYSASFGPRLFPGMACHPIFAIPKPNTDTFRLINNHNAGKYYLNSLISSSDTAVRLDNLEDLSKMLRVVRKANRSKKIWLFKSDVSQAYRRLPVHPLWQIRQVVKIDGGHHVDRCCVFGNRGSGKIWCGFMALVIWGAIHAKGLKDLLHYVDDVFSYELTSDLMYYPPYNKKLPSKQARLLKLWDEIGLPHEEKKQEYGLSLEILGMQVDTECMTITIPLASKQEIVALVTAFIDVSQSRMRSVEEWKKVVARLNWGLTVEPLLRPALQSSHSKLSGKTNPKELLELDDDVVSDLKWIADMFAFSTGINIMDEKDWRPETADLIMFCDATLYGLGYWSQTDRLGFYAEIPRNIPNFGATYNECHAVVSALEWASRRFNRPHRVLIWTDSMNVVTMFDKLKALQGCNDLLFAAVKILIRSNISLRIFHLPREENVVADALSRGALDEVHSIHPSLKLSMFRPTSYTGKERLY